MDFRVDLQLFRGPLDLLLYLVRKHEVPLSDIPVAAITEQFLDYLAALEQLDVNAVGDFLEVATLLVEMKSEEVLPRAGEVEEPMEDPRQDLVERLLEYKRYRDAASILDERARLWQQQYPRLASDLPARQRNWAEEPIAEVELWDLVSAFGRIIRETESARPSSIVYDDTPIQVYMARTYEQLQSQGQLAFRELFRPGMHKSSLVSIFLAVLELVRHHQAQVEQKGLFGEILLKAPADAPADLDLSGVDGYDGRKPPADPG